MDITNIVATRDAAIAKYIKSSVQVLTENSLVQNNMDMFLKLMRYEDEIRDGYMDVSITDMKMDINLVRRLTEEFIVKIDSSGELLNEYIRQKTCFDFDGTVNTAHNLIYEFMKRWVNIQNKRVWAYGEYTLLKEFLPIYYANAFVYFLKDKQIISASPAVIIAHMVRKNYCKDPNKCVNMFLAIWSKSVNCEIGHKEIVDGLKDVYKVKCDCDEMWNEGTEKLMNYIDNTIRTGELSTTFTRKFAVALAECTSYSEDVQNKLFKLARYIKNGKGDWAFMQEYFNVNGKTVAEFLEDLDAAMAASENEIEENAKARWGIYQKEEIVSVEPGVKYLIEVDVENNWVKLLNGIKRFFWKVKNKKVQ